MINRHTVEVYKALADDVRLGIVKRLACTGEPVSSCDIVASCSDLLQLSQPAISHHFGRLVHTGIVIEVKRGKQKAYILDRNLLSMSGIDIDKVQYSKKEGIC